MLHDFGRLLRSADYRKLFIGQLVSSTGDWLATFAFLTLIFALTGRASDVAIILVVRLIPPIFAAPVGGVLADRMSRRTIMVGADLIRAGIILVVPFVGFEYLYVLAFVHECVSLFFLPARDALIPQLVSDDELEAANGLILASSNGVLPLAGLLFSALESVGGNYPVSLPFAAHINRHPEVLAFFVDALSFVLSALLIARIRVAADTERIRRNRQMRFFANFLNSLALVWRNAEIRRLAYGITLAMFGGGVLFSVGVGYVHQTLHQSSAAFGWLIALWGAGMAIGLIGVRFLTRYGGRFYVFMVAMLTIGGILLGMSLVPIPVVAFALAAPFGAAFATALILATTLAQEYAPADTRGATMGGLQSLLNLGLGLGAICMGWVATVFKRVDLFGITLDGNQVAMFLGGLLICLGVVLVGAFTPVLSAFRALGTWSAHQPTALYHRLKRLK
ncbi:MAG TPA: MFS transporter [Candidatus Saccharimonadales bacterium]|jgi:dTMP kinase